MSSIPVIYLTGEKSARVEGLSEQLGASAVIYKPYDFSKLLDTVKRALDGKENSRSALIN